LSPQAICIALSVLLLKSSEQVRELTVENKELLYALLRQTERKASIMAEQQPSITSILAALGTAVITC
jgi:hypothetical protein